MKIGDVVQLKSGGTRMTVIHVDNATGEVSAVWMDAELHPISHRFSGVLLALVQASDAKPKVRTPRHCECGHPLGGHNGDGLCMERLPNGQPCALAAKCKIIEATEE